MGKSPFDKTPHLFKIYIALPKPYGFGRPRSNPKSVGNHETLLIQGSGPIGLYATAVGRSRGACRLLVIGGPEERLRIAREWGADETLSLDEYPDARERQN